MSEPALDHSAAEPSPSSIRHLQSTDLEWSEEGWSLTPCALTGQAKWILLVATRHHPILPAWNRRTHPSHDDRPQKRSETGRRNFDISARGTKRLRYLMFVHVLRLTVTSRTVLPKNSAAIVTQNALQLRASFWRRHLKMWWDWQEWRLQKRGARLREDVLLCDALWYPYIFEPWMQALQVLSLNRDANNYLCCDRFFTIPDRLGSR